MLAIEEADPLACAKAARDTHNDTIAWFTLQFWFAKKLN
jgi:hypothetical protein